MAVEQYANDIIDTFYHEGDGYTLKGLNTVLPLIAISLGTIGELISIKIFSNRRFMTNSISFYNLIISTIEFLLLYIGCLKFYLQANLLDPLTSSMFWCKSLSFLVRSMLELISWIQLLMTLDSYLFVHYPNKFDRIRKKRMQIIMIALIFLVFSLYNLPVAIYYGKYEDVNSTTNGTTRLIVCFTKDVFFFVAFMSDMGLFLFYCIVPFSIMFYLTVSIAHSFIKAKKKVFKISKQRRRGYRFAFSIIFQNILFLLFTLLLSTLWPIASFKRAGLIQFSKNDDDTFDILLTVFNFFLYFYFSSKFLAHLLFNSLYRQVFIEHINFISCFCKENLRVKNDISSKSK